MCNRIYQKACAIFERQGIAATTMRQVAAECGVGASTIYDYFGGKDDIVAEFFRREKTAFQAILQSIAGVEDSGEAIIRLLSGMGAFWLENLILSRVVAREIYTLQKETIEAALNLRNSVLETLRSLLQKQQTGPERLRINSSVGAGMLLEIYRSLFSAEGGEPEALARLAWSLFMDGARVPGL